jgi:membrane-bound lytic murein transglycosylase D
MNDEQNPSMKGVPILHLEVKRGQTQDASRQFTGTFLIGRTKECDVQLADDCISRSHLQVALEGREWKLKDLGSTNGTFLNGERITEAVLPDQAEVELGTGGPVLAFRIERPKPPEPVAEKPDEAVSAPEFASETQIIKKFFTSAPAEEAGEQTLMFRRAFERAHKKKSKKYLYVIGGVLGVALVVAIISLAVIHHQKGVIAKQEQRIAGLRKTAENIYYSMKALEIQISQLEDIVMLKADPTQVQDLQAKRKQLDDLARQYDSFVTQIGAYKKMPAEKIIIYKMARTFGECDVNVPDSFVNEVMRYVGIWKSSGLLKSNLQRGIDKGYAQIAIQNLKENNLPRHFMFLALRESEFNPMAVGRTTRYGIAKGMWQFLPDTAQQYGLKIGPQYDKRVYDLYDERFYVAKASKAAARYLRDLNNTDAQASGLLVMASYNWGDSNVLAIIKRMPGNPRDRNFWRLLQSGKVPKETYDYVLSIFSAAVICENPRLFGFDFDTPRFADE